MESFKLTSLVTTCTDGHFSFWSCSYGLVAIISRTAGRKSPLIMKRARCSGGFQVFEMICQLQVWAAGRLQANFSKGWSGWSGRLGSDLGSG
jgi:hypothetical protein